MEKEQFKKIISLIRKTGDKLIVLDESDSFAIMRLEDYEKLIIAKSEVKDLTEDELLDKINRDIAIWKTNQAAAELLDKTSDYDKIRENQIKKENPDSFTEDKFYIEPNE